MNQQPMAHPDYDSLQSILSTIAQWMSRYREAFATRSELANCSPEDVAGIARDLKIAPTQLASLARKGPDAAALLRRLLLALGVKPTELERGDPAVMRDLQRLCITCGYKRKCERDLAAGTLADEFRDYCPNAYTLDALLKAKH
ncbi:MAG: hypothetical protein P8Y71_25500 [Pseudolabrys sp.]